MESDTTAVAAANLRRLRETTGISRRELLAALESEGVSIHQTTLSRIEAGTQPLKLPEAVAFARVYDVRLDYLLEFPDRRGAASAEIARLEREAAAIGRRADAPLRDLVRVMKELGEIDPEEADDLIEGAGEVLGEALEHLATAVVGLTAGLSSSSADEARYRLEEEMYVDRGEAEAEVERLDLKARVEEYLAGLHDGSR